MLAEAIARVSDPVAALRTYEDMRRERTRMLVRRSRRLQQAGASTEPGRLCCSGSGAAMGADAGPETTERSVRCGST